MVVMFVIGCGPDQISATDETTEPSGTSVGTNSTTGSETETGSDSPTPEQQAQIDALDDELMAIVEGALDHFAASHPVGDEPGSTEHVCPHPDGNPAGGESGFTPMLGFNCNDGPNQQCAPIPEAMGNGYYDVGLWIHNPVWMGIGFQKTEPHFFHYNFMAVNQTAGYGGCTFTAQAFADLDDDIIFSTYERRGRVDQNGAVIEELFVDKPFE